MPFEIKLVKIGFDFKRDLFPDVDTNLCERCINEIEDFEHMLWSCRYSVEIWKETEKQINEMVGLFGFGMPFKIRTTH